MSFVGTELRHQLCVRVEHPTAHMSERVHIGRPHQWQWQPQQRQRQHHRLRYAQLCVQATWIAVTAEVTHAQVAKPHCQYGESEAIK